jgi:phosphatidylserine/phosphatidylglycerophosphate/cardiolipin synthase-like enzyme
MSLGRDIATLYRNAVGAGLRLFGRGVEKEMTARSDFQAVLAACPATPAGIIVSCMQSLAILEQELQPRLIEAEFVATLPATANPDVARPIRLVIAEMLEGAAKEVIAVGYEIVDESFIAALRNVARRVPLTLIRDRERSAGSGLMDGWPSDVPRPIIFQDRLRPDAAKYAKMHGKALLVDGTDLLISSANFTFHGMHGNVEFGVRLRGAVAGRAGDVFRALVRSGLLERCP